MNYGLARRRRQVDENSGESASYADRQAMTPGERLTFRNLGGRFRSRPGAPMAQPPQGLTTGGLLPVASPEVTAGRDAEWGSIFGRNSVYGGRGGRPITQPPLPTSSPAAAGSEMPYRVVGGSINVDTHPAAVVAELEDFHRSNGIALPDMQPIAEADDYTTGRRTKSFQLGKYGTGSVSTPLPQRLTALNTDPDFPEL